MLECYSCVKALPQHAIDVRGYADFAPLGHSVRVHRDEQRGTIAWRIKFRNGTEKNFLADHDQALGLAIPGSPTRPRRAGRCARASCSTASPRPSGWTTAACTRLEAAGLKPKKGVVY